MRGDIPERTVRAVRDKAELLNGGASLGEIGDAVTALALERALAWCQREDVPRDMEQAAARVALALFRSLPEAEETEEGEDAAQDPLEGLVPAGAVKTIQRGDTSITFASSGGVTLPGASGGSAGTWETVEEALAGLAPWRRLGRLREGV